jgi:uncharacterized protein
MAYNQPKSFLGTGWSFPPQFLDTTEGIKMSHDDEDIAESIYILLTTLPGERIMTPEYGCDLHSQVYKNINRTTLTTIEDMILTAIQKFEPRVDVDNIFIDTSQQIDGKLSINITYIIKGVNSRKNLVYPFYLIEGTDV